MDAYTPIIKPSASLGYSMCYGESSQSAREGSRAGIVLPYLGIDKQTLNAMSKITALVL